MADFPDHTTLMQILGSEIMVPIDLQAAYIQMPIDVQGAYIQMPVDIQGQYITLEIDITAQSIGNLDINIAAQEADIDVNITNATINIAGSVSITGTPTVAISGTVTVTISGTVTVTISGTADIDITAQSVGIATEPIWQTYQGNEKNLSGYEASLSTSDWDQIISYAVPSGKTLYVTDINAALTDGEGSFALKLVNYTDNISLFFGSGSNSAICVLGIPKAIPGDKTMRLYGRMISGTSRRCDAVVGGYEL